MAAGNVGRAMGKDLIKSGTEGVNEWRMRGAQNLLTGGRGRTAGDRRPEKAAADPAASARVMAGIIILKILGPGFSSRASPVARCVFRIPPLRANSLRISCSASRYGAAPGVRVQPNLHTSPPWPAACNQSSSDPPSARKLCPVGSGRFSVRLPYPTDSTHTICFPLPEFAFPGFPVKTARRAPREEPAAPPAELPAT